MEETTINNAKRGILSLMIEVLTIDICGRGVENG